MSQLADEGRTIVTQASLEVTVELGIAVSGGTGIWWVDRQGAGPLPNLWIGHATGQRGHPTGPCAVDPQPLQH